MKNQSKSYIFAGLSILAWSSVSTAFKLALGQLNPAGLLFFSALFATLFLACYNYITGQHCFIGFTKNIQQSLFAGFLNPYLYYVVLFIAYNRLRAQEAQSLNYTWAIMLSILSVVFLGEHFRLKDMLALLVSLVGVFIISTQGSLSILKFDDAFGSSLAIGSSFIWALYWIVSIKDKRPNSSKLFYNFLVGTILISLHIIITQESLFKPQASLAYALLSSLWVGIFEMGLTFLLWLKALQLTNNTAKISNLIFLSPFISMFFIQSILKESIHPATIIGLLLIVVSNLVQKSNL